MMDNLSEHPGQERFNIRNQLGQITQSSFNKTTACTRKKKSGRANTAGTDSLIRYTPI